MLSQSYHDDSLLKAVLSTESFPSPVCSHLVEQPGRDIAKVFLLQLVLFATGSIDADVLERIHDTLDWEAHFHEPVDHVLVVAVVSAQLLTIIHSNQERRYIRSECNFLLLCLCVLSLLPEGFSRGTAATLSDLLLGRTRMFDRPLSSDVFEFGRVPYQHARHLSVLRILGFGCAEEGLQRDESGLDSEDRRPLGAESVQADSALKDGQL